MSTTFDDSQVCQCIFRQQAFVTQADELIGQVLLFQPDVFWPELFTSTPVMDAHLQ
jgi:hypothetical protein